jgi:hypothetical protein
MALRRRASVGIRGADVAPNCFALVAPLFPGEPRRRLPTLVGRGRALPLVSQLGYSVVLDSQRILVRTNNGEGPVPGAGQWSDNLPKLIQQKVVQSLGTRTTSKSSFGRWKADR